MRKLAVCLMALWFALVPDFQSRACMMVPRDSKSKISQSAQEAILFFADEREELILKVNYRIAGETMPDRVTWIVTIPNEPDAYSLAPESIFDDVSKWSGPLVNRPMKSKNTRALGGTGSHGVELGQHVNVGPYDIQPIRALGSDALAEMNTWLEKNGFPTEDPKHMAYFVENKFTFLCIKISPPEKEKAVAAEAGVKPLHLSFKTAKPYYPLKFSSRQGVFDVNLTLLTKLPFDYAMSEAGLKKLNYSPSLGLALNQNVEVESAAFPESLKKVFESDKSALRDKKGAWQLNVVRGHNVNQNNAIAEWKEDVFLDVKSAAAPAPVEKPKGALEFSPLRH